MNSLRTRFAPSPTGYLHVGGIRTALFAWLLARQQNGKFILRIEDTDKDREVEGSTQHIIKCLISLGLDYDEGPNQPGPYGPYRQSERLSIYRSYAETLIKLGRAYADPYSKAELANFRRQAAKQGSPFLYRNHRPSSPPDWKYGSLPLRFKSDPKAYRWQDEVMGNLSAGEEAIDDFILIKSDGFPTYNFAHIVDDYEMKITHIIRGQEFIASTPNYLNLYEALNITRPLFVTPPPVLGPSGNKKLSKRDGAKDVLEYIKQGYLEAALLNFIASLGWNDGTTQEIYTVDELIKSFSLKRIVKSGARFDERRLLWMSGAHIRMLSTEELTKRAKSFWPKEAIGYPEEYKIRVLSLVQERLKFLAEIPSLTRFFFVDLPLDPSLIDNNPKLSAIGKPELKKLLGIALDSLAQSDFSLGDLQSNLNSLLDVTGQPPGILFSLIRIASTQAPASPPLAESLKLLGKERTLKRIKQQIGAL
jgi:glutamyl-tRNA synthetase